MEENPTKDLTLKLPRPCIFKGSEKQASNSHRRAVNQACAFPKWKHIGTVEGAVAPRKMRGQGAPPSSFSLGPEKNQTEKRPQQLANRSYRSPDRRVLRCGPRSGSAPGFSRAKAEALRPGDAQVSDPMGLEGVVRTFQLLQELQG